MFNDLRIQQLDALICRLNIIQLIAILLLVFDISVQYLMWWIPENKK